MALFFKEDNVDFSDVKSKNLSISSINHFIETRRRGTFVVFNVTFLYKETPFSYQMKIGKKSIWRGLGFHHQIIKTGYVASCLHCEERSNNFCTRFKRTQRKLTRALIHHPDFIKEIKKQRVRLLVNEGIDFLKM